MKLFFITLLSFVLFSCTQNTPSKKLKYYDLQYDNVKFDQDLIVTFPGKSSLNVESVEYKLIKELQYSGAFNNVYIYSKDSFDEKNDNLILFKYEDDLNASAVSSLIGIGSLGILPIKVGTSHSLDVKLLKNRKVVNNFLYNLEESSITNGILHNMSKAKPRTIAKHFAVKLIKDLKDNEDLD